MLMTYTNRRGNCFILTETVIKGSEKIRQYEREYKEKAEELTRQLHKDIFFCLKYMSEYDFKWTRALFFLIPIERDEVDDINKKYGEKAFIGINYVRDAIFPKHEYTGRNKSTRMSGYDYEEECAEYLRQHGFTHVDTTPKSGDQGIDVIAYKNGKRYGIQCKYYQNKVSNKAVQEAFAGAANWDCDYAVVMTNSEFTKSAIDLAHKIGVLLWSTSDEYK